MNTKEILVEINNLQGQINNLRERVDKGVYNYLKDVIGIESANSESSEDLVGKVVAEGNVYGEFVYQTDFGYKNNNL